MRSVFHISVPRLVCVLGAGLNMVGIARNGGSAAGAREF